MLVTIRATIKAKPFRGIKRGKKPVQVHDWRQQQQQNDEKKTGMEEE